MMGKGDEKLELRGGWRQRCAGTIAGWFIKLMGWTLRLEVTDRAGVLSGALDRPLVFAIWHNRIFVVGSGWPKLFPTRKMVVLTSASRDGAVLASAMRVFGLDSVRGSSSRRGRAALVGLMRKIKEGRDIGVTPDGPRGPRYVLQPGVVKLAQACRVPIVPVRIDYERAWVLNSWDRFRVPKPFSRVSVIFEPALEVPRELDDDAFEAQRLRIEGVLRDGITDLLPENDDQD